MPDGKTHLLYLRKLTIPALTMGIPLIFAPILFDAFYHISMWSGLVLYVGYAVGYCVISLYIDPDADQISLTSSEGRLMRRFGCLGFLAAWWMMPYAYIMRFFGGHRGLAHVHVIGTLTRVVWVGLLPALFFWLAEVSFPFQTLLFVFLIGTVLGLMLADSVHILLDNHYRR